MPFEEDPWATKEFYVKWKRWSYIHCSWDTRETLAQLGGYKRVMNYMKRQVSLSLCCLPFKTIFTAPSARVSLTVHHAA